MGITITFSFSRVLFHELSAALMRRSAAPVALYLKQLSIRSVPLGKGK